MAEFFTLTDPDCTLKEGVGACEIKYYSHYYEYWTASEASMYT